MERKKRWGRLRTREKRVSRERGDDVESTERLRGWDGDDVGVGRREREREAVRERFAGEGGARGWWPTRR